MGLHLLLGRAGTGKTRRCLEEVRAELEKEPLGPPLILITPDQATFNMERELALLGGSLRAQVYSFRRLAYRVLREAGGAARLPVNELGRRMILKKILLEERDRLALMGALQNRPGFLSSLSELIGELKMCRITPEDLGELIEAPRGDQQNNGWNGKKPEPATDMDEGLVSPGGEGGPACSPVQDRKPHIPAGPGWNLKTVAPVVMPGGLLERKLADLYLVYRRLAMDLAGRFADPDDYLDLLARQVARADFLNDCRVWLDGFASFTPQEYAVLQALLVKARDITVTLTLDPALAAGRPAEYDPFVGSWETRRRLHRLARQAGMAVREEYLEPDQNWRLARAPDLAHLERHYFHYPTVQYAGPVERVQLFAAVSPRAEVEGVARAVRRLLREEGFRPRQIMVTVRDVEVYFPLFKRVLADYEIPFFIDHRQPVMHHPLVELLRSALEIWQKNWAYDPVFRYLKTGLTRVEREEVDRLENYVLAAGIRGSRWYSERPWEYLPGGLRAGSGEKERAGLLDGINRIRWRAIKELRRAQKKAQKASAGRVMRLSARRWAAILLELCLDLGVPQKLEQWCRAAREESQPALFREHRQVWRLVGGLLDQLVETLGEAELTLEELSAVMDAGFEATDLALIPPVLDAVTVGSLDRSRPSRDVQVLFVPGLTEGVLPARLKTTGVFTDWEREALSHRLAQRNRELPPGTVDRLQQEQFLVYRVLTRTGGRLILSHPLGDSEGRAVTPSPVVRRVKELLPGLKPQFLPADPSGEDIMEHPSGLLPQLALRWRDAARGEPVHPVWWRVYNLFLEREEWREKLALVRTGLMGRNMEPPLGRELGRRLWGVQRGRRHFLKTTVYRLERFVQCPFAHFLAHGLGLEERQVHAVAPPDTGQLYHEALRRFVEQVQKEGPAWEALGDGDIHRICAELVEQLAPALQNQILLSSARLRRQKERLLERVSHSARALARQIKNSRFRPAALEVSFGTRENLSPRDMAAGQEALPFWTELCLPPLELALDGETVLHLVGRIDRVDLGRGDQCLYLRVIDYKSGAGRLDLAGVLAGAQLQLLVYLWAALEHFAALCRHRQRILPAGAFYFQVQRPLLKLEQPGFLPEELEREWLKEFRLSGWLIDHGPELYSLSDQGLKPGASSLLVPVRLTGNGSPYRQATGPLYTPAEFRAILDGLRELLCRAGRDILDGRVDIAPLKTASGSGCQFCAYRPVCRFDLWLPENRFRSLQVDRRELRRRLEDAGREGGKGLVLYNLD
ncbi:helicase-exonuclease AddAB subunit AddB [Desulfofundulus thermobenzoicus]|uniref:Helicase-exonuclease AddAB subunit AddB n=1 Tax=Desulfofundulus thermobenzoicus TaxID=29376 RepID=A0A6N7IUQ0_9FIRM|nr:helicase-exonuclease AddAB subunit AddB [Desulfofundulus thermobenzoicus]